eukprot:14826798-Ditylum_brightwellii.AAC.1
MGSQKAANPILIQDRRSCSLSVLDWVPHYAFMQHPESQMGNPIGIQLMSHCKPKCRTHGANPTTNHLSHPIRICATSGVLNGKLNRYLTGEPLLIKVQDPWS